MELIAPAMPMEVHMPRLPVFAARDTQRIDMPGLDMRAGFTLELVLTLDSLAEGQSVLNSQSEYGPGPAVRTCAGLCERANDG